MVSGQITISKVLCEEFDDGFVDLLTVHVATPGVKNEHSAAIRKRTWRITMSFCLLLIGIELNTGSDGRCGGGLAIVYQDKLHVVPVLPQSITTSCEVRTVRFAVGNNQFILANVYRSHNTSITTFYTELSDIIDRLLETGGHALLVGDLNCGGDTPSMLDHRLVDLLSSYSLTAVHDGPTRLDPATSRWSRLDVIAESDTGGRLASFRRLVSPTTVTLSATLKTTTTSPSKQTSVYRGLARLDIIAFRHHLAGVTSMLSPPVDPNEFVQLLDWELQAAINKFAPNKR